MLLQLTSHSAEPPRTEVFQLQCYIENFQSAFQWPILQHKLSEPTDMGHLRKLLIVRHQSKHKQRYRNADVLFLRKAIITLSKAQPTNQPKIKWQARIEKGFVGTLDTKTPVKMGSVKAKFFSSQKSRKSINLQIESDNEAQVNINQNEMMTITMHTMKTKRDIINNLINTNLMYQIEMDLFLERHDPSKLTEEGTGKVRVRQSLLEKLKQIENDHIPKLETDPTRKLHTDIFAECRYKSIQQCISNCNPAVPEAIYHSKVQFFQESKADSKSKHQLIIQLFTTTG